MPNEIYLAYGDHVCNVATAITCHRSGSVQQPAPLAHVAERQLGGIVGGGVAGTSHDLGGGAMAVIGSVYTIAKALYLQHGFDPDVAVSAAHCYVKGTLPTASYAQAMYYLDQVKHPAKLTKEDVQEIERAYLNEKIY